MDNNMNGMDYKIRQIAGRIRELRQISGFTPEEMALLVKELLNQNKR